MYRLVCQRAVLTDTCGTLRMTCALHQEGATTAPEREGNLQMLPISFGSCNFYPSHNELLHAQLMTIRPENIPADGVIRGMVDLNGKALVVEMSGMCLSDVGTPPSPVGYGPGRPHPITGCVVGYAKFLDHVFSLETRHLSLLNQEDRALASAMLAQQSRAPDAHVGTATANFR